MYFFFLLPATKQRQHSCITKVINSCLYTKIDEKIKVPLAPKKKENPADCYGC
jgi:hypothetical protein